jgi:hypothetical protein
MTDQVSRRVWRLTIGLLIGVSAITISLAFIIAASGQPSTRSMLWAGFDDQWSITSGAIAHDRLQLRPIGVALRPIDSSAFAFEARLVDNESSAGLIVEARDERSFVAFLLSRDGYFSLGEMRDGAWIDRVTWRAWPHVRRGDQSNVLRAECDRSACTFFVNDEWTWHATDLPAGNKVGLLARDTGAAIFDQVTAWQK